MNGNTIRVLYVGGGSDSAGDVADRIERESDRLTATGAPGVSEGVDRLPGREFDGVASTYRLPESNGIEFLRTVRERRPKLPFVLHTASGGEEVAAEAVRAGVTDYVREGTDGDAAAVLSERIEEAVERRAQRRTERERRLERYEFYLEQTRDAITAVDPGGVIQYESPAIADLLGYDPDERIGTPIFEYIHPEDQALVEERFTAAIADAPGNATVEFRAKHRDGSWRWVETRGAFQPDGHHDGVVASTRDITERKERERELERQNERLDQFASIVSHDLRNPLQVAGGSMELLQEECDSDHIRRVQRALDRMDTLIENLLTLARDGEVVTDVEPVDPGATVESCWTTVDTGAATLQTDTDAAVRADRTRLKQVFENLIRNAVEHSDADDTAGDGVTITVGELSDGFFVADDGPGIPESERSEVFEAGYSTSRNSTGFGLAIVQQIVHAHDWEIDVTESADGGTRFEITGVETPE